MSKDDACEAIWEAAEEEIYQWLSECSPIDRPSESQIQRMIEGKYSELLAELLEGA